MRRLASLALAVTALASTAAARVRAQDLLPPAQVALRVESYVDDDATTVWRPRASWSVPIGEHAAITGSYMADVISSASIDVVTRATQAIDEERHEGTLGVIGLVGERAMVGGTYGYGREPDYDTHAIGLLAAADVGERRLWRANGRLQLARNQVGTVADPRFRETLTIVIASGGLSRILDEVSVLRGTLELSHAHGFQSSAYRTVRLGDWVGMRYTGTDPEAGAWVFTGVTGSVIEHHPDERLRAHAAIDLARAFGRAASFVGSLGGYADTWRVGAGDFQGELRYEPRRSLLLRFGARAYVQSGASFFRYRYQTATDAGGYFTDDKELGPMRSYALLLAAMLPLGRGFRLDVRVEGTRYAYPRFSLLPEKHALATQVGLSWSR